MTSPADSSITTPLASRRLVLGSTSPYRKELLSRLGVPFDVMAPLVEEALLPNETPCKMAMRLALAKAQAVSDMAPEAIVIGSDQVADLGGNALGKPGSHENAVTQLTQMSGKTVIFHTAVAVVCKATGFVQTELAQVSTTFRPLTPREIEVYLLRERPYDCAGSAKSEGLGIALLERIDNDDPTALVGLPLIRTCRMLRAAGLELLA